MFFGPIKVKCTSREHIGRRTYSKDTYIHIEYIIPHVYEKKIKFLSDGDDDDDVNGNNIYVLCIAYTQRVHAVSSATAAAAAEMKRYTESD